ncbi:MAG: hypothetical protein U5K72_04430 [Balneolaceae bacterium]|nr:hypothetical protein [Balneolaceae bacterium]
MYRLVLILVFVGIFFTGCSGCSESGIRHQSTKNFDDEPYNNGGRIATPSQTDLNSSNEKEQNLLTQNEGVSLSNLYSASKSAVFTVYTSDNEMIYQGSGFFVSMRD